MSSESEDARLFRVWKTLQEMLNDRGYLVSRTHLEMTLEAFRTKFSADGNTLRVQLTNLLKKRDDPNDQIFVFFPEEAKVGVQPIRERCMLMSAEGVKKAIIVVQEGITPGAKAAVSHMKPTYFIETFTETELLVNITQHVLVPEHIALSMDEKAQLLERYKCKDTQLPRMQHSDPVARYYGLARGTVVKIVRPSETAGRYVTYRLVV